MYHITDKVAFNSVLGKSFSVSLFRSAEYKRPSYNYVTGIFPEFHLPSIYYVVLLHPPPPPPPPLAPRRTLQATATATIGPFSNFGDNDS